MKILFMKKLKEDQTVEMSTAILISSGVLYGCETWSFSHKGKSIHWGYLGL